MKKETEIETEIETKLQNWFQCYEAKDLLKNHSLNEIGYWMIKGEDINCDMGGSHYQPFLGIVHGKLDKVVRYAIQLPRFFTWGAGGTITSIIITNLE